MHVGNGGIRGVASGPDTPEEDTVGPAGPRRHAYHAAYALFEGVQSEHRAESYAALPAAAAEARQHDWLEVGIVLEGARLVHDLVAPDRSVHPDDVTPLCRRAESAGLTALQAVALGLRALAAGPASDSMSLMADASLAVALLDDESQPALDRCTGYVVAAGAFNRLRLWELVDELYGRARALETRCEVPAMANAIAVNRVLTGVEWAVALLENGDWEQCRQRLAMAEAAVPDAFLLDLPPLWRRDVEALGIVASLLSAGRPEPLSTDLEACRQSLVDDGDIEALPLLDAAVVWSLWHSGDDDAALAACARLTASTSVSAASPSFPSWVRAQVLAGREPSAAVRAQADHAALLGRLRWQSREAVLVSARAQIGAERRGSEHERLVRAANTDPLTGLHNRRAFDAWLGQPPSSDPRVTALVLLDLDGFKQVNDGHGHDSGDEVLRRIGHLLQAAVRPEDLAVRHGGDEFAVLLSGVDLTPTTAEQRARELLRDLRSQTWDDVSPALRVSASIGVAVSAPGTVWDPTELYRAADAALYAAKRGAEGLVVADLGAGGSPAPQPAWA
jgi:diguanylate cyclase (GGDEF)-like protein